MKIVVIGGSGFIGSKLVNVLRRLGHEVIASPQTSGLNMNPKVHLTALFYGTDVVIDVADAPLTSDQSILEFFQKSGYNLLAAEAAAGVRHHITLSVVGIERMQGSSYFRARKVQEKLVKESEIPYTILQATQFFELVRSIAQSATVDGAVRVSDAKVQPVASDDVTAVIAELSIGAPLNITVQVAGPDKLGLDELIRIFLRETADTRQLITDRGALYYGLVINDLSLTPGDNARIGKTRFIDWLRKQDE